MHETYEPEWIRADCYSKEEIPEQEQMDSEYTIKDMEKELEGLKELRSRLKSAIKEKREKGVPLYLEYIEDRPLFLYLAVIAIASGFSFKSLIDVYTSFWVITMSISITFISVTILDLAIILRKSLKDHLRKVKVYKSELEELVEQLDKTDENIRFKEELIENAKATLVKPDEIINMAKQPTVKQMEKSIKAARERMKLWDNEASKYKEALSVVLGHCTELIKICKNDSSAINEISEIYNVLIAETLSVVERYSLDHSREAEQEISTLIINFDNYVKRKVKKYKNVRSMVMSCDIATLNKVFKSE